MSQAQWAAMFWAACALIGCRNPQQGGSGGSGLMVGNKADQQKSQKKLPATPSNGELAKIVPKTVPNVDQVTLSDEKYQELSSRWGPAELVDLGPAASVSASPQGAVFITRTDQVLIAKRVGPTGFAPVDLPPEAFSKYGWGPAVSSSHVYWASHDGKLKRASLSRLQAESLFDSARPSTRTSVQTVASRDIVAFVAEISERSYAYIWASKGTQTAEILDASADGHEATSLSLVRGSPHPRLIVLEGRTGMSPVHSRVVRVTPRRILLEPNEIVWIGPGSHDLTEIHALDAGHGASIAFLPTQKDFHDFGLAQILIRDSGGESPEPTWHLYPNGLDPAPLTSAHMCDTEYVLFARPSEKRPHAPQELHIAPLTEIAPGEGDVLVRARAFNDLSISPTAGGAIIVWTADKRSWGMVLSCPQAP